jgi:branched-chain amino acid transport system permease protein
VTSAALPSTSQISNSNTGLVGAFIVLGLATVIPLSFGSEYLYNAILAPTLALGLAALGLNVLTGYTGQPSLASAGFMAIGAFAAYNLNLRVPGLPMIGSLVIAGLIAAGLGLIFCLPGLRLKGFYLAVSTLAAQFFVEWATNNYKWLSNYSQSGVVDAPPLQAFGYVADTPASKYFVALTVVAILTYLVSRLVRTQTGMNFIAIRDNEVAAQVIGVPVMRTKLIAFAISTFIIGIAGVLWAFTYLGTIQAGYGGFGLGRSFSVLFCIIIGGLATIRGAYLGAAFMVAFPLLLSRFFDFVTDGGVDAGVLENWLKISIGSLIIIILIYEPDGLSALLDRATRWVKGIFSSKKGGTV